VVAALVAAGLLGAGYVARDAVDGTNTAVTSSTVSANSNTATGAASTPVLPSSTDEPVAAVAKALGPAVVQIRTEGGLGSGVVYDESGLIITNDHVVAGSNTVQVGFADGSVVEGKVLGSDSSVDIGVVQVSPPAGLTVASLAPNPPAVGEMAVAVGSPFGLAQTVTAGVVSAIDRPVDSEGGIVVGMVQTDAAINPGNSGGALANRRGEVIGINTQILSQKGENNGVGFAVPIARAKDVADRIVAGKPVDIAYLGVSGIAATDDGAPGAKLGTIESGSPADQAGLRSGDVVTAVDGQPVRQPTDLAAAVANRSPGEQVKVEATVRTLRSP
jgi:S1-C subfamily serine protease